MFMCLFYKTFNSKIDDGTGFLKFEFSQDELNAKQEEIKRKKRESSKRNYLKRKDEGSFKKPNISDEHYKSKKKRWNRRYYMKKQQLEVLLLYLFFISL